MNDNVNCDKLNDCEIVELKNEADKMNLNDNIGKIRRRNRKTFEHWLLIRFQPKFLTEAIKSLSPSQRNWVKRTGFGSLLNFRMNEYPQSLGYYLALSFKNHCSSLCYNNVTIPVNDEDVHEVLGIPMGGRQIVFMRSTHTDDLWRGQFIRPDRVGWKVTANMVCDAIKRSDDANRMFKLNFLVLMTNILIEGPTNPYVKQTVIGFTGDLDRCSDFNWCQYLVSQLKIATVSWVDNPENKYYTGSVPFLVVSFKIK